MRRIHRFVFILIAVALVAAPSFSATEEELQQAYAAAIKDAEIAEPSEVSTTLVSVTEDNHDILWTGIPGDMWTLAVTWTSWDGYDQLVGKTIRMNRFLQVPSTDARGVTVMKTYEATRDIWVTMWPDVKTFCQENKPAPEELDLRLEQLLGLPPHDGKTRFVEFLVKPEDLFRPTPDPDITNHVSTLEFPADVSEDYKQWFDDQKAASYGENGYPWTRLGYTYDWGKSDNHYGLSEFVIRIGAEVNVFSVTLTDEYCGYASLAENWSLYN